MSDIVLGGPDAGESSPAVDSGQIDLGPLLSEASREIVAAAAAHSAERGDPDLDASDLLWAATQQGPARALLADAGIDPDALAERVTALAPARDASAPITEPVRLGPTSHRALVDSRRVSRADDSALVEAEHLLLGIAADARSPEGALLRSAGDASLVGALTGRDGDPSGTPLLDELGDDLTEQAREGALDPIVGRAGEIDMVLEVLARLTRNNPVLVGEPGVGRSAIVAGIAHRVVAGTVPAALRNRRVVRLDLVGVVEADARERVVQLLQEIRDHATELVVFVADLPQALGAKSEGASASAMFLRRVLARGELNVVSTTTADEYRQHIEQSALADRFVPVPVAEPTQAEAVAILRGRRTRLAAHHRVRLPDEVVTAAVSLSARYLAERMLPEKALDLLDQAGARAQLQNRAADDQAAGVREQLAQLAVDRERAAAAAHDEHATLLARQIREAESLLAAVEAGDGAATPSVTVQDVAEVVARSTGLPIAQLTEEERDRLARLDAHLGAQVLGQPSAVRTIAEAVRRSRTGLAEQTRPIGSFLLVGPSGVGKTELARALGEALFGDHNRVITLDMNAYLDPTAAGRLIGHPLMPGRPAEAGVLTEAVRRQPYAVVLLEDLDQAHHDVYTHLGQACDTGRLIDGHGRAIDFRNTVLIMTTRLGSEDIDPADRLGFGTAHRPDDTELRGLIWARLRRAMPAHFLDRLDDLVVLRHLSPAELRGITLLLLAESIARLQEQGIAVEVTDAAVAWIVERAGAAESGARPLRRLVRAEVDNRVSALIVAGELRTGGRARVDTRRSGEAGDALTVEPRDR